MTSSFDILAIDARDPRRLAGFWCSMLGSPGIDFLPVRESKTVKNRLHLDHRPVGVSQEKELARLLGLGARRVDVGQPDDASWVVLADPEGNEFCVLRTPAS